jgi:hypothetical protein
MSEQDIDKIRKVARGHKITPRPEAWNKLHNQLKAKKLKHRLFAYRNLSIAAILVAILSVTVVFTMYLGQHDPDLFSSNEDYLPVMLEDLEDTGVNPFYDVKYIDQLHDAYAQIGF